MNELVIKLVVSVLLSAIIAGGYYFTHKEKLNIEMLLTIMVLPIVVTMIIYTIGSNIAGAFSLSGIFSIVRFRSEQASFKDITYILSCVAIGLASATAFYVGGLIFTIISLLIILVFEFKTNANAQGRLDIIIPEDMQDRRAIDKIIKKYCKHSFMSSVKTRDLGSLYEYRYQITFDPDMELSEMIDEIRIINGNLPIKVII